VDALVAGAVNFDTARFDDPLWVAKFTHILNHFAYKRRIGMAVAGAARLAILVAAGKAMDTPKDNGEPVLAYVARQVQHFLRNTSPAESLTSEEVATMRQEYIKAFGADPLDPKFRAWETQTIEAILAGHFDVETEDQQNDRLMASVLRDRLRKKP
jgi:hypothetical protein